MLAIRPAEVYRRVAVKRGLDSEVVASIGAAVFMELVDGMQSPKVLAYELDHVGTFAIRHANYKRHIRKMVRPYPKNAEFKERWKLVPTLIEDFKQKKQAVKQIKNEFKQKAREQGQDES